MSRRSSLVPFAAVAALGIFCVTSARASDPVGLLLGLPPGARAIAMGMAQGAVAEGPDAAYWNPAALAFVPFTRSASFTYSRLNGIEVFPFVFAAYAARIAEIRGAVAASFAYFDYGSTPVYADGMRTGRTFRPYEMAPAAAFGGRVTENIAIGAGFKIIRIDFTADSGREPPSGEATSPAVDLGFLWRGRGRRVRVGASIQNLGPDLELGSMGTAYPPLRNLKLAFGARVLDLETSALTVACDLNKPLVGREDGPRLDLGGEMSLGGRAAMRIGWRYDGWYLEDNEYTKNLPDGATTMGFGVNVKGFAFDYANAPWEVHSPRTSHHLTVSASF